MQLLAYLVFIATLTWFARGLGRGREHVLLYFGFTTALFYGFRATILVTGLDTPEPSQFFVLNNAKTFSITLLVIVGFLLAAAVAYRTWFNLDRLGLGIYRRDEPDAGRMLKVTMALTAIGALVTVFLWIHFGGGAGILRAGKLSHGLAGLYVFKEFAALGAVVAAATTIDARRLGASRAAVTTAFVCMLLDAYFVYLWGTRTVAAISVAIVVIGWRRRQAGTTPTRAASSATAKPKPTRQRAILRYTIAAVLIIIVAIALRATRQGVLNHGQDVAASSGNVWHRISLSLNATYLDASMLAVQDDNRIYNYPTGTDFVSGAKAIVPGFIWAGKDTQTSGARFRHIYQPAIVNGWPVGAPTAWDLNFGPLGLLLGGYLSGIALAALAKSRRRAAESGFNFAITIVTATVVLQMGVNPDTLQRVVLWWLPLIIIGRMFSPPTAKEPEHLARLRNLRSQIPARQTVSV